MLPTSAFWVFVVLCVVMGFSVPLFGAPITAMFQGLIDPAKLGRVMSLYMTIAMLAAPIGLLVAGPLAERVGVARWFAISGVLIAVMGADRPGHSRRFASSMWPWALRLPNGG